ncbi:MAG: ribosome biogenesis GTPase YlqF [Acholeplasmatales bacterium]|nr:ribosome biogenesis GTPase YlqF [Acholeplasmatales bacterium]
MPQFQWYPGHMAKAERELKEFLPLVDIVIELRDARIPYSSKNPVIDTLIKDKYRLILLNKATLADKKETEKWIKSLTKDNTYALDIDCITGYNLNKIVPLIKTILKEKLDKLRAKGLVNKTIRSAVVGIPNVGKSTFINKMTGKKVSVVGDKPGVTKHLSWFKVNEDLQILDTPGILWPKFESEEVGIKLSVCQGIKDEIIDIYKVCVYSLLYIAHKYPNRLIERYKLDEINDTDDGIHLLEDIAKKRGFIQKGAKIDYDRTIVYVLNDVRSNRLGAITFEESN